MALSGSEFSLVVNIMRNGFCLSLGGSLLALLLLSPAWGQPAKNLLEFPAIVIPERNAAEQQLLFRAPAFNETTFHLCAVLPNVSDEYWDAVISGIKAEALQLGVSVVIYEASGYGSAGLRQQQRILEQRCAQDHIDAVLLAAIDDQALNSSVALLRNKGVLVIDLINGYDTRQVDAHAMVDFMHLGRVAAESLLQHKQLLRQYLGDRPFRLLWVPGPQSSGWAKHGDQGFTQALKNEHWIQLETYYWGPHYRQQSQAIGDLLAAGKSYDLIAGTAPTILAAIQLKHQGRLAANLPLLAYYTTPDIYSMLDSDQLINAVTDNPELQGRTGVALAVGMLQKRKMPFQVGPVPQALVAPEVMAKKLKSLYSQDALDSKGAQATQNPL